MPDQEIRQRILYYLSVYPVLSPSHLGLSLGTNIKVADWKPILEDLIKNGKVSRTFMMGSIPNGKSSSHTLLRLGQ